MDKIFNKIEFLVGEKFQNVDLLLNQATHEIFSSNVIDFLSEISNYIMNSDRIREYPDVATFAFFCRRSNVKLLLNKNIIDSKIRIGKGIIFHITPGNVPVNFAYSFFAGLITGNINIVRIPSKNYDQIKIITDAINYVLKIDKYKSIFEKRLFMIKYDRDIEITDYFSSFCDVRIIWGGDETIKQVRKSPIPPKSTEITFSDRYSITIIKADRYLNNDDKEKIASDFYNDTYLFDQNACTSPHTIYWLGGIEDVYKSQKEFWKFLQQKLQQKKYQLQPIHAVDKMTAFYTQAIYQENIELAPLSSNDIFRVQNKSVQNNIDIFKCHSGYFNEVIINNIEELNPVINRKFQTIGYYGFDKNDLSKWVQESKLLGADRIVPIGRTMNFSMNWDGYDLISSLTRVIEIE